MDEEMGVSNAYRSCSGPTINGNLRSRQTGSFKPDTAGFEKEKIKMEAGTC